MKRRLVPWALAGAMVAAALAAPGQALAVNASQSVVVSENPADYTPQVQDGQVLAVAVVGNIVVIGGTFTSVKDASETTTYPRNRIAAFDATTGAVETSFVPTVDGDVTSLVAGAGGTVYVGGRFSTVDGVAQRGVARLNVSDGSRTAGFAGKLDGANNLVNAMVLRGTKLYVGGRFSKLDGGTARSAFAVLDATTGAVGALDLPVTVSRPGDTVPFVRTLDVTADGSTMLLGGNFKSVGGQPREQIAMVDLVHGTVSSWQTERFVPASSLANLTYVNQIDISPDGDYFVVVTTGGKTPGTLCDSASRWEMGRSGAGQQPTWVDFTGGDSLNSVALTGAAVYVAGHPRWFNNFNGNGAAGPGAVPRQTIAALDPASGLPLPWDPTMARPGGSLTEGPEALLATPEGLWVGWDADTVGKNCPSVNCETHKRIAFFPVAGGTTPPGVQANTLPRNVYVSGTGGSLDRRSFNGTVFGSATAVPSPGSVPWATVDGAFMAGGDIFYVNGDDKLYRAPFDGSTVGAPVNTGSWWGTLAVHAMTYDSGRLYYTKGDGKLYYRYFLASSALVGSEEIVAATASVYTTARQMFVANAYLYYAQAGGDLWRVPLSAGLPTGSAALASGPGKDGITWNGTSAFLSSSALKPFIRLFGQDRTGTSIAVSQNQFSAGSAGAVVLARSDAFPDGLAGAPLARAKNAPLLLNPPAALYGPVKTEIQRVLHPGGTVYLLGGTGSLSVAVDTSIKALGYTTVRLWGPDRSSTAVAIAGAIPGVTKALLASGLAFPDALGAGAAAGASNGVVLLTNGPKMPASVLAYLNAHPSLEVWGVGGDGSAAGLSSGKIISTSRALIGADRTETATKLGTAFFPTPQHVVLVNAVNFPDGLSGGPYAAALGGPVLLTMPKTLAPFVASYMTLHAPTLQGGAVLGGPAMVSDATLASAASAIS